MGEKCLLPSLSGPVTSQTWMETLGGFYVVSIIDTTNMTCWVSLGRLCLLILGFVSAERENGSVVEFGMYKLPLQQMKLSWMTL